MDALKLILSVLLKTQVHIYLREAHQHNMSYKCDVFHFRQKMPVQDLCFPSPQWIMCTIPRNIISLGSFSLKQRMSLSYRELYLYLPGVEFPYYKLPAALGIHGELSVLCVSYLFNSNSSEMAQAQPMHQALQSRSSLLQEFFKSCLWLQCCPILKGCGFHSLSGHMPTFQVQSPIRSIHLWSMLVREATNQCFSLAQMFFSLPSTLSKRNETMSLGEENK